MELSGKKVLVTGGGSGYGLGIAQILQQAGAEVWITGRRPEKLQQAAARFGLKTIVADATCDADWERVFATMKGLDVLINNAGAGGHIAALTEQSAEEIIIAPAMNYCESAA